MSLTSSHRIDDLISHVVELQRTFPSSAGRPQSLDMTLYWLIRLVGQLAHDQVIQLEKEHGESLSSPPKPGEWRKV